jgi:hypothetical protein
MATKQEPQDGEVLESRAVTIDRKGASGVMIAGVKYELERRVNVPTLKHDTGETVAFTIILPLETKKNTITEQAKVNGVMQDVERETEITVARIIEISSGQEMEYVCNAITADNLLAAYPEHTYVGKTFGIKKLGVVAGKRYKDVEIIEIKRAA